MDNKKPKANMRHNRRFIPKKDFFKRYQWGPEHHDPTVDYSCLLDGTLKEKDLGYKKLFDFFMRHPVSYRKIVAFIFMKQVTSPTQKHTVITLEEIRLFSRIPEKKLLPVIYYLDRRTGVMKSRENDTWRVPHQIWDNNNLLENLKKAQLKEAQLSKKPFDKLPKDVIEERVKRHEQRMKAYHDRKKLLDEACKTLRQSAV